ncbi:DMT family transporter [Desulfallas thermosapovorans]|uniref:EamA-like transporter family protein n=1 Tax=Desulfallas thermosapovorans DSM 6562 TaxID=1121431 RepID=A0A5S4ZZ87_9FIRM|nr:DMT family transporter [Desulfallas thermosapovorans]TYO98066.1 EamA-like transporter family protein [Desulfallas thermosapovorans DSM 6562]
MLNKYSSTAAAITVAIIFGFSFFFTKSALFYLNPFQLLGLRFALAAVTLTFLVLIKIIKLNLRFSNIPALIGISLWQPVIYFVCETYGVKNTTASESGIVIALVPVAVTFLSFLILKERVTYKQAFYIGAAVLGVIMMTISGEAGGQNNAPEHNLGIGLLFCAVISAGFYNIFSRKAAGSHTPIEITFVMMWSGALVFNVLGLFQNYMFDGLVGYAAALQNPTAIWSLLYLGILSSVVAFFLLNYALSKLPAPRVSVFMNLTPIVSVLAGAIFLNEYFGLWQGLGGIVVLIGVWGTNKFSTKPGGEHENSSLHGE